MRILLLEDNRFDAELTAIACRASWTGCEIIAAQNRERFLMLLNEGPWAAVISDSGVPDLNGEEALEIVRRELPGLPFYFLCGSINPERRRELERAGSAGIISKDDHETVKRMLVEIHKRRL